MYFSEQTLAIIASGAGVLATLLGLVGRMVWSQLHSKSQMIEVLEAKVQGTVAREQTILTERDAATRDKVVAEATLGPVATERDKLKEEIEPAKKDAEKYKQAAAKYKQDADKYLAAVQEEHRKRKAAEERVANAEKSATDLQANLAIADGQVSELETQLTVADKRLSEGAAREKTLQSRLNAEAGARQQAEGAAKRVCSERDKAVGEVAGLNATIEEQREALERYEKQIDAISQQDGRIWEAPLAPTLPAFVPLAKRASSSKEGTPIISILNLKGGVGKTTITGNLGGFIGGFLRGDLDKHPEAQVLLIDLDHQRSLSQLLLSRKERELAAAAHTIQRFFRAKVKDGQTLLDCSRPVPGTRRCRLITNADPDKKGDIQGLEDLEMRLMSEWLVKPENVQDVRFLLREALQSNIIRDQFSYVLLDCPPRLTTACINALVASDFLLIPCQAEAVSLASVNHLLPRIRVLRDCGLLSHLRILGVVANMVHPTGLNESSPERIAISDAKKAATRLWGSPVHFFTTMMKRDENYAKASRELEANEPLRLAIDFKAVREDFTKLSEDIQKRIKLENRDVAGVPA